MLGIYGFIDSKDNKIVYVGKDAHIERKRRYKDHTQKWSYNLQRINQVVQNNPNRYTYQVLNWNVTDPHTLNALETQYIRQLKPKFNYTDGGDGIVGFKHSKETKKKISNTKRGKKASEETKRKLSIAKSGKNNPNYGKTFSKEHTLKLSQSHNSTGFFRVSKSYESRCSQGFAYIYSYYEGEIQRQIRSVDFMKLEKKVKDKGLEWFVVDEDKADITLKEVFDVK